MPAWSYDACRRPAPRSSLLQMAANRKKRARTAERTVVRAACGQQHAHRITKSPQDRKQYRWVQLPNELQVLLIHDPEMDLVVEENGANSAEDGLPEEGQQEAHSTDTDDSAETSEEEDPSAAPPDGAPARKSVKKVKWHAPTQLPPPVHLC